MDKTAAKPPEAPKQPNGPVAISDQELDRVTGGAPKQPRELQQFKIV